MPSHGRAPQHVDRPQAPPRKQCAGRRSSNKGGLSEWESRLVCTPVVPSAGDCGVRKACA